MAIDKTIPNRLQADADQRLVRPEVGEMIDAQNVTMAESGSSSSGVIKNVRGTIAGTPLTAADRIEDSNAVTVIGSVSDPQRGFIYWFVADNSASSGNNYAASEHAIYQYNTSDDTYKRVIKAPLLRFRANSFVKADVVNSAFQQDGVIQSALYFTDGINPPRKINVDRQLALDYGTPGSDTTFNQAYGAIKSAPNNIPSVVFETDASVSQNNFNKNIFQFAYQYVYTDGEESAISPYSAPAIPRGSFFSKMDEEGYGVYRTTDNVVVINPSISTLPIDVERIRFLARKGNNGAFFIVDDVTLGSDVTRDIYGSQVVVFDNSSRNYRFYNDSYGDSVSQVTVNKLYDNIPFTAVGQSITGNRVMYSNYEEGRPNVNPIVTMDVNYSALPSSSRSNNFISTGDVNNVILIDGATPDPNVKVDLLGGGSFDSLETTPPADFQTVVPAGTSIEIKFKFDAGNFTATAASGDLISADSSVTAEDLVTGQGGQSADTLTSTSLALVHSSYPGDQDDFVLQYSVSTDSQINQVISGLNAALFGIETVQKYSFSNESFSGNYSGNYNGSVNVYWRFDDTTTTTSTIIMKPRVSRIEMETLEPVGQITGPGGDVVQSVSSSGASWNNVLDTGGNLQSEISYSSIENATYISNKLAKAFAKLIVPTFKSGSTHDFGLVYYDEHNRSGNVNELGSVYVEDVGSSARTNRGPASVTINFDDSFNPPSWAKRFQIVYSGRNSIGDFTQYTVGDAYRFRKKDSSNGNWIPDPDDKRLAVSLITLDKYKDEKNPTRDYSFTEGDKLRVIRRRSGIQSSFTDSYPLASDSETVIEFNIIGVKQYDSSNQGEIENVSTSHNGEDPHIGTFLIIESPEITSLVEGVDGNTLKYTGYDWFEVTGEQRENGDSSTPTNYWPGTTVEMYSPKSQPEQKVYYEIGHGADVGPRKDPAINDHGDSIVVTNGDCYFRPVSCKMSYVDPLEPGDWFYQTLEIESDDINDEFSSSIWAKGRAHLPFENAATIRRYNGITYSDAYAEDVANLSLSSFNPSLANFFSLDSANGACNYIGTFRDDYLLAFQENRVARVPVNKDIITSPTTDGIVSISTNVLNTPAYYAGDFGCGSNPESVLIRDGNGFFVDTSRKKLVRLTSEGLSPISENGVDSLFKSNLDSFLAQGGSRIVSGYDPEDDQYYVTLRQINNPSYDPEVEGSEEFLYGGLTLGYNVSAGVWQSRYTFYPDMYADQNGTMYSATYVDPVLSDDAEIFFSHTNETDYNTFYGTFGESLVKVVSNYNPSMSKVFNAISLEGAPSDARWTATSILTDTGALGSIDQTDFVSKEGSRYAPIRRDSSDNSTKHIIPIGEVASADIGSGLISFVNRVNTLPLMAGSAVMEVDGSGNLTDIGTPIGGNNTPRTLASVAGTREIQLNAGTSVSLTGSNLVLVTDQDQNGDPIRGHWAEITLTNNQATLIELYCVNTHFVQSNQDHSLGQQ